MATRVLATSDFSSARVGLASKTRDIIHRVSQKSLISKVASPPTTSQVERGSCIGVVAAPGCPAYAGMDPVTETARPRGQRLPRLRGDGPPHATTDLHGDSGCPAYAGMDPRSWTLPT